jgi:tetratricopeptide (TPR) repeat protein
LCNLGQINDLIGKYDQADRYFQDALELARDIGKADTVSDALIGLGHLTKQKGDLNAAKGQFEQGLETAQKVDDETRSVKALIGLRSVLSSLGELQQAEDTLMQGISIAKENSDSEGIIALSQNLAWVANARAIEFLEPGDCQYSWGGRSSRFVL